MAGPGVPVRLYFGKRKAWRMADRPSLVPRASEAGRWGSDATGADRAPQVGTASPSIRRRRIGAYQGGGREHQGPPERPDRPLAEGLPWRARPACGRRRRSSWDRFATDPAEAYGTAPGRPNPCRRAPVSGSLRRHAVPANQAMKFFVRSGPRIQEPTTASDRAPPGGRESFQRQPNHRARAVAIAGAFPPFAGALRESESRVGRGGGSRGR